MGPAAELHTFDFDRIESNGRFGFNPLVLKTFIYERHLIDSFLAGNKGNLFSEPFIPSYQILVQLA